MSESITFKCPIKNLGGAECQFFVNEGTLCKAKITESLPMHCSRIVDSVIRGSRSLDGDLKKLSGCVQTCTNHSQKHENGSAREFYVSLGELLEATSQAFNQNW